METRFKPMRYVTLSIIFLCASIFSTAQIRREYNHVIASPTPAELGRFASMPVSLSTGTINVSVPVYTLECGSLSLPVALTYNASGIRVDQIASWVGLGWNLMAGGSISVNVVGNSDLERKRIDIKDFSVLQTGNYPKQDELHTLVYSDLDVNYGAYDSQPDIFNYNFNGYTGQFLLDNNLTAHVVNDMQRLQVTVNKSAKSIRIVDNKGVVYNFSAYETTTNKIFTEYVSYNSLVSSGKDPVSKTATTAYFLSKITSPDGADVITFNYVDETLKYTTGVVAKLLDYGSNQWDGSRSGSLLNPDPATHSEVTSRTKRLSSISTNKGDVMTFSSNLSRADLNGGYALTDIVLKRGTTPALSWKLDYSYFDSNPASSKDSYLNKRLELNSITCQESGEAYQFSYYGHAKMPYRTAYTGRDMWGYYNGPGGSPTAALCLFPNVNQTLDRPTEYKPGDPLNEIPVTPGYEPTTTFNFSGGHSQEVNPGFVNTYALQKIKYPTGGYTEFIYQSNTYSFCKYSPGSEKYWGGLRIYKVISYNDIYQSVHTKTYTYVANMNRGSSGCVNAVPQMCKFKVGMTPTGMRRLFPELSSAPYNQLYTFNGDYLIYKQVQERDENGYIDHYYTSFYEYPNSFFSLVMYMQFLNTAQSPLGSYGYYPSLDFDKELSGQHYARNLEFLRNYYNTDGTYVKAISYKYSFEETNRVFGMEAIPGPSPSQGDYNVNIYYYPIGRALLDSVAEYRDKVTHSIKYAYNPKCLVNKETHWDSDGKTIITTRYPSDINNGVYASMSNIGMWDYPIEETTTKSGSVSGVLNTYRKEGSGYYPDKIYTLNQTGALTPFTGTVNPAYREKVSFARYNNLGNLLQVTTNDGMSVSYIWGYKGKYPIAEIKNVTYYTLENVISGTKAYLDELLTSDSPSMGNVNSLRGTFPSAHIRTFTYHPTFGISSECDAKGLTFYYEYTTGGKLKGCYRMVNGQKQYLKSYEYNFRH